VAGVSFSLSVNIQMEAILYQPEGDPIPHEVTAEVADEDGSGLIFRIRSDGEEIGEVDVELLSHETGFVSGVGPGERINNGYLAPATLAIQACLEGKYPKFRNLFDIDNELLTREN